MKILFLADEESKMYWEYFKKEDCIPVFPELPVSSLSAKTVIAVHSGTLQSKQAFKDEYAQTLSSCPYAPIMLLSKPISSTVNAGTSSNSAERKSLSTTPYFW